MKTFLWYLISLLSTVFLSAVVLFDPSEAALGVVWFTTIPVGLAATAEVLGNVIWILGVLWVAAAICLFAAMVDGDKIIEAAEKLPKTYTSSRRFILKTGRVLRTTLTLTVGIVMVGSGFWFTGTALILFNLMFAAFENQIKIAVKKYGKEED